MLVYETDRLDTGRKSFGGISNLDPNVMYLKHYENLMYLTFIANRSESIIEKFQAQKELVVCERKLEFWKKKHGFDLKLVADRCVNIKKTWNSK